jgi:hypothetical protein
MAVLHDLEPTRQCAHDTTLALSGVLANAEKARLARSLARRLVESRVVVVDTSCLRLHNGVEPTIFSNALIRAGGWPAARLILTGADARLKAALARSGVARDVLLVDDVAHAHTYFHVRPQRVARRLHLTSGRSSIPRAIALVESLGLEWDVPADVIEDSRRTVRELVKNAIQHAHTASVLQVSSDPAGLRVAVRDFRAGEIGAPRYGLGLVSSVATDWGLIRRSDGKSVWALLGNNPSELTEGGAEWQGTLAIQEALS